MDDDQSTPDTSGLGAASPIADPIAKAYAMARKVFGYIPGKGSPSQPADHGGADPGMVEEANQSFRKANQKTAPVPTTKNLKKAPTKR